MELDKAQLFFSRFHHIIAKNWIRISFHASALLVRTSGLQLIGGQIRLLSIQNIEYLRRHQKISTHAELGV